MEQRFQANLYKVEITCLYKIVTINKYTSCIRSRARILSNVSKDGESPPCKQKTWKIRAYVSINAQLVTEKRLC